MSSSQPPLPYKQLLFNQEAVAKRIEAMALEIIQRYRGQRPLFVCLLYGGLPFSSMLMTAISQADQNFHADLQFLYISRYGSRRTAGTLRLIQDLPQTYHSLNGRLVVVLDDLLDEGYSLRFARKHLLSYGAGQVDAITMVKKQKKRLAEVKLALYGFRTPDVWLTGMGMDDPRLAPEANRWAPWIAVAKD